MTEQLNDNNKSMNSMASLEAQTVRICLQCRRHCRLGFDPWVGKIPKKRQWQPSLVLCQESPMDRGAWQATVQGSQRVRHNWVTKHNHMLFFIFLNILWLWYFYAFLKMFSDYSTIIVFCVCSFYRVCWISW